MVLPPLFLKRRKIAIMNVIKTRRITKGGRIYYVIRGKK